MTLLDTLWAQVQYPWKRNNMFSSVHYRRLYQLYSGKGFRPQIQSHLPKKGTFRYEDLINKMPSWDLVGRIIGPVKYDSFNAGLINLPLKLRYWRLWISHCLELLLSLQALLLAYCLMTSHHPAS